MLTIQSSIPSSIWNFLCSSSLRISLSLLASHSPSSPVLLVVISKVVVVWWSLWLDCVNFLELVHDYLWLLTHNHEVIHMGAKILTCGFILTWFDPDILVISCGLETQPSQHVCKVGMPPIWACPEAIQCLLDGDGWALLVTKFRTSNCIYFLCWPQHPSASVLHASRCGWWSWLGHDNCLWSPLVPCQVHHSSPSPFQPYCQDQLGHNQGHLGSLAPPLASGQPLLLIQSWLGWWLHPLPQTLQVFG